MLGTWGSSALWSSCLTVNVLLAENIFLNGIAARRHHCQVRNTPWTMLIYGVHHQKVCRLSRGARRSGLRVWRRMCPRQGH